MAFEEDGGSITIRTLVEPLVGWIWVGAAIMGLGAFIALQHRSRKAEDRRKPRARPHPDPARDREEVMA
jgi:cytochrome c biogenesis factor